MHKLQRVLKPKTTSTCLQALSRYFLYWVLKSSGANDQICPLILKVVSVITPYLLLISMLIDWVSGLSCSVTPNLKLYTIIVSQPPHNQG